MAVVTPLNNSLGPEGDTVTTDKHYSILNTPDVAVVIPLNNTVTAQTYYRIQNTKEEAFMSMVKLDSSKLL